MNYEKILVEWLLRNNVDFDYVDSTTVDNIFEVLKDENIISIYELNEATGDEPNSFKGVSIQEIEK